MVINLLNSEFIIMGKHTQTIFCILDLVLNEDNDYRPAYFILSTIQNFFTYKIEKIQDDN